MGSGLVFEAGPRFRAAAGPLEKDHVPARRQRLETWTKGESTDAAAAAAAAVAVAVAAVEGERAHARATKKQREQSLSSIGP